MLENKEVVIKDLSDKLQKELEPIRKLQFGILYLVGKFY
jgi:hypothetical protein